MEILIGMITAFNVLMLCIGLPTLLILFVSANRKLRHLQQVQEAHTRGLRQQHQFGIKLAGIVGTDTQKLADRLADLEQSVPMLVSTKTSEALVPVYGFLREDGRRLNALENKAEAASKDLTAVCSTLDTHRVSLDDLNRKWEALDSDLGSAILGLNRKWEALDRELDSAVLDLKRQLTDYMDEVGPGLPRAIADIKDDLIEIRRRVQQYMGPAGADLYQRVNEVETRQKELRGDLENLYKQKVFGSLTFPAVEEAAAEALAEMPAVTFSDLAPKPVKKPARKLTKKTVSDSITESFAAVTAAVRPAKARKEKK